MAEQFLEAWPVMTHGFRAPWEGWYQVIMAIDPADDKEQRSKVRIETRENMVRQFYVPLYKTFMVDFSTADPLPMTMHNLTSTMVLGGAMTDVYAMAEIQVWLEAGDYFSANQVFKGLNYMGRERPDMSTVYLDSTRT